MWSCTPAFACVIQIPNYKYFQLFHLVFFSLLFFGLFKLKFMISKPNENKHSYRDMKNLHFLKVCLPLYNKHAFHLLDSLLKIPNKFKQIVLKYDCSR